MRTRARVLSLLLALSSAGSGFAADPAGPARGGAVPSAAEALPGAEIRYSGAPDSYQEEIPDFQRHVVPLLGRLGCNGRACHGSFQGRGGFRLSLFGFDFQMDHAALTGKSQSAPGSRIDKSEPPTSLLLRKPTEQVDHEGGERFATKSWQHALLVRWIESGARGCAEPQTLTSLEVEPAELNFREPGEAARLRVVAHWEDGTREEVTCLCRFRTNDDAVATVDNDGWVRVTGVGGTHVIVFYDNGVAAVPVALPAAPDPGVTWPQDPRTTRVDQLVNARLRGLGLVPSPVCSDAEFLRRVSIDLTGTLPAPAEVEAFLADSSPDKRDRKIDELLDRPSFAAWWATKLCDFTGCNPNQQAELGQELAEQWYMWVYQRLRENTPYDEIVERIMLAQGRDAGEPYEQFAAETSAYFREESPADFTTRETMPHYWSRRTVEEPADKAMAVAHSFLGLRLQCAQCHKHPWDRWTQQDFQQFTAFFEDVQFGVAPDARSRYAELAKQYGVNVRGNEGSPVRPDLLARAEEGRTIPWREVYVRDRAEDADWQLLGSGRVKIAPNEDPRRKVMQWMRDPENPWFARAIVNRVWASCFHVGIVDPPDDLNAANPPSNPELLDYLAESFVAHDYDLRWLLREIVQSSTWQRSSQPNATNAADRRNFSRMIPRRLPAEVIYDGVKQALAAGDEQQRVRLDLTRRAVGHLSMRMAGTYAMHVFGKPERAVTCDCERVNEPTLLQSVFMQNDPLIHMRLDESGWLAEIRAGQETASEADVQGWIRDAWLRAVGRPPTEAEAARARAHLASVASPAEGLTDLMWSLLNTKEFLLKH